ncbi:Lrp/AsnC family transcriptional regulator [Micromonospora sp. NPDC047074]|uniref:Lrp/AsnC family transcriptional regulator n=1 Tax=Micromonospora sp. NPDC047074 TaxID=3154339 RepID=UPI0033DBA296
MQNRSGDGTGASLDELDRQIIGALLAHPRATHAQIGEAVFTSEATVSRRIPRLIRSGAVRVIGVLDGETTRRARSLFVRLRCRPDAASRSAEHLARWQECGSVKLLTGSFDCLAEVSYTSNDHLLQLMFEQLPGLDGVLAIWSNQVIRRFATPHNWSPSLLPADVVDRLRSQRVDRWNEQAAPAEVPPRLVRLDEMIIASLGADGRQSWQQLAERCSASPATVRRRAEAMMVAGSLRMRTVVEPSLVGLAVNAFIFLSIHPTQLGQAGELLAAHPAVLMIAATTGDRNLCGEIALESDGALYEFLSGTIGQLPGLQHADVAVALRSVKRAGMIRPPAPRTGD